MELPTQVFSTHSAFPGDILKCLHLLLIRDASHLLLMSNAFAISEFHSGLKYKKINAHYFASKIKIKRRAYH